jgi:biopolymer transport protein ExbD
MPIDFKKHKQKLEDSKPQFNLVPLIDILFTILIFLVVANSFANVADVHDHGGGKPNITDTSGNAEYYLFPIAGLQKVIVNGQDMSHYIKNNAIAIRGDVMDKGDISIESNQKTIVIRTPEGVSPSKAVTSPNSQQSTNTG